MNGRTLADLPEQIFDAVIVGAGPAGSMAAGRIAAAGKSVLLLDKASFPRAKACGCCLNHAAVAMLDEAAINLRPLGAARIDRFMVAASGCRAVMDIPAGLALSRETLDQHLIDHAVRSGAVFSPRTMALDTTTAVNHRQVRVTSGGIERTLRARVILAADGLAGRFSRQSVQMRVAVGSRIGVAATLSADTTGYEQATITMACSAQGYAGVVRIEGGLLHVGAALDPRAIQAETSPALAVAKIIAQAGLPAIHGLEQCPIVGAGTLTRRRRVVAQERLFILGDAAGYVEPFSGEGMAWALAGGWHAAELAIQAMDHWNTALADQWQNRMRTLRSRQKICRLTALLLRHPVLTRPMIRILGWQPAWAKPALQYMNRPYI